MSEQYEVVKKNKIRQLRDKANYDVAAVHAVLDAALTASVGFVDDGNAIVVPMIYGRVGETLYLHGARKARIIRLLEQNVEACVNVTLIDGIVFARSAFNSSMNYRSATVYGTPTLVDDYDDKVEAMRIISEHTMPGRWAELREPLSREVKMTGVIALEITHGSAKIASGPPDDEDDDYAIPIWAGVLPVESTRTQIITDEQVLDGVEPSEVVLKLQHQRV
ncbi:MAG: pyridoxamine 5'-phosphate oxidase family protein [Pseudomonadota bacterium]